MTVLETWANPPVLSATVTPPGGTTAAAGPETWTMGGGWGQFPLADPTTWPPAIFRVFDLHDPSEIILVRDNRAAPTWQVTRADQGSAPVAHRPGFAVHNVITGPGLDGFAQGVPSGNGLVLPAAGRRAVTLPGAADLGAKVPVATLGVPAFEATPGSLYELLAFGYFWTGGGTQNLEAWIEWTGAAPLAHGLWLLIPNGIVAGTANVGSSAAPCRWRMHGLVNFHGNGPATGAAASILLQLGVSNTITVQHLDLLQGEVPPAVTSIPVTTTANGSLSMSLALPNNVTGGSIFATGGKAWRAG